MRILILIFVITLSFLLSPAPRENEKNACGRYVRINGSAGFMLNPDTYGFLLPAITPDSLVQPRAQRQGRPLFILMGSAVGYTLHYISSPFHSSLNNLYKKFWTGAYPESMMYKLGNFYVGFIIINILVLWLSLYLFQKIFLLITGHSNKPLLVLISFMVFIASNQVTKVFFWTPHMQMFTFFTPLLCIYIALKLNHSRELISFKKLCWLSLASGFLLLVYGNFLLLLPVLLYCFSRNYKLFKEHNLPPLAAKNLLLVLLFALPLLAWMYILTLFHTTYYNFEIDQYRQLIWVKDTLSDSWDLFWATFRYFTQSYIKTMGDSAIVFLFALVVMLLARDRPMKKDINVFSISMVLLVFFLFYWILGFYRERLSYSFVPGIICLLSAICRDSWNQIKLVYIVGVAALCWHLYNVMSYGPFC